MKDRFSFAEIGSLSAAGMGSPPTDYWQIAPSDANDLREVTRGLLLDKAGLVHVITKDGSDVTLPLQPGLNAGRFTKVFQSGTDPSVSIFGAV